MSSKPYPEEFKTEAVKQVTDRSQPPVAASMRLNIGEAVWKRSLLPGQSVDLTFATTATSQADFNFG